MRMITLIATTAAALSAATLLAGPANADQICRRVCDDGFCRTRCVERGDRLYLYDRDRDYDRDYYHHRRPGVELHVPGAGIEIGR
jgi:hypothetical protein